MKITIATTPEERNACFAVRKAVFMGEQGVSEAEEWDGLDEICVHFLAGDTANPAGCARLLPKGDTAKVQRVAVMPTHRGTGLGRQIMLGAGPRRRCRIQSDDPRFPNPRGSILRTAWLCRPWTGIR